MKKIRKGDTVMVVTGRDKGKQGSVLKVVTAKNRVIVQGVNMIKRHFRGGQGQPPGIVDKEAAIHVSNVALIDPKEELARANSLVAACSIVFRFWSSRLRKVGFGM